MNRLIKNIPNAITLSRIISCIVASILFTVGSVTPAIICYLYGAISDAFDGLLARKLDAVTEFGKKLDPISDKLYALSLMIPAVILGNYSMILPLVLEGVISCINMYSELKYKKTHTEIIGKLKTIVLFPTMILGLGLVEINSLKYLYYPFLASSVGLQIGSIKTYTNQLQNNKRMYLKNQKINNENIIEKEKNEETLKTNNLSYNNNYSDNYSNKKVKKLVRKRDYNDRY